VRVSAAACLLGALGALGGGWLVGRWCLGLVLIALSGLAIVYGVLRDDGTRQQERQPQVQTLQDVLDRARRSA
jgi:hypothetical protein